MKTGYAVRLCDDGKIDIVMFEESERPICERLRFIGEGIEWIEAVNLPLAEKFMLGFSCLSERPQNKLGMALTDGKSWVSGDVILLPVTKGEYGEEMLIGMPLEVAETVAGVCNICRYALENGIFDTLMRKDAEE